MIDQLIDWLIEIPFQQSFNYTRLWMPVFFVLCPDSELLQPVSVRRGLILQCTNRVGYSNFLNNLLQSRYTHRVAYSNFLKRFNTKQPSVWSPRMTQYIRFLFQDNVHILSVKYIQKICSKESCLSQYVSARWLS